MPQKDDHQKEIDILCRRLQKLREQKAQFGVTADPAIDIEIEDIEAKLGRLRGDRGEVDVVTKPNSRTTESRSKFINIQRAEILGCKVRGLSIALSLLILAGLGLFTIKFINKATEVAVNATPTLAAGATVEAARATAEAGATAEAEVTRVEAARATFEAAGATETETAGAAAEAARATAEAEATRAEAARATAESQATAFVVTPTPTPVYGIVIKNSTIRGEPTEISSHIDFVFIGEKVALESASQGNWVNITAEEDDDTRRSGWVRAKNVDTSNPLPTVEPAPIIRPLTVDNKLDIEERSVVDKIDPWDETKKENIRGHVYTFTPRSPDLRPTVNIDFTLLFYSEDHSYIGTGIQIALYDETQYNHTKHLDITKSKLATTELSGEGKLTRLTWHESLLHDVEYYLRIVNKGSQTVFYCLAVADVERWDKCP